MTPQPAAPISDEMLKFAREEYSRVCSDPNADTIDILEQANNLIDLLSSELAARDAELARLRGALRPMCARGHDMDTCDLLRHGGDCTCGYTKARAALKETP